MTLERASGPSTMLGIQFVVHVVLNVRILLVDSSPEKASSKAGLGFLSGSCWVDISTDSYAPEEDWLGRGT